MRTADRYVTPRRAVTGRLSRWSNRMSPRSSGAPPPAPCHARHTVAPRALPAERCGRLAAAWPLAGYRNDGVYLRKTRYVPRSGEAVREPMPAMFDLLDPRARLACGRCSAVVFRLHSSVPDGNGPRARFLMNVMLASGERVRRSLHLYSRGQRCTSVHSQPKPTSNNSATPRTA